MYFTVGKPCQKPIIYSKFGNEHILIRSNNKGICYAPSPRYVVEPEKPYISGGQMQEWPVKAAASIRLCEEDNGNNEGCKEVPSVTGETIASYVILR